MIHNTRSYSYCVFRLLWVGSIFSRDEKCSAMNKVSKFSFAGKVDLGRWSSYTETSLAEIQSLITFT
jgi:hypothetical protein